MTAIVPVDAVKVPPTTAQGLLDWTRAHPKRIIYPRPANSGPARTFLQGLPYILKDKDPEPSGYEGLLDVRVIQAIYESIHMGRAVRLPAPMGKKKPGSRQDIRRPAHGEPQIVHAHPPSKAA